MSETKQDLKTIPVDAKLHLEVKAFVLKNGHSVRSFTELALRELLKTLRAARKTESSSDRS